MYCIYEKKKTFYWLYLYNTENCIFTIQKKTIHLKKNLPEQWVILKQNHCSLAPTKVSWRGNNKESRSINSLIEYNYPSKIREFHNRWLACTLSIDDVLQHAIILELTMVTTTKAFIIVSSQETVKIDLLKSMEPTALIKDDNMDNSSWSTVLEYFKWSFTHLYLPNSFLLEILRKRFAPCPRSFLWSLPLLPKLPMSAMTCFCPCPLMTLSTSKLLKYCMNFAKTITG